MTCMFPIKSRGAILCVTSLETRFGFALAKFEYSLLIGQCWSLRWSCDMFFYKITTLILLPVGTASETSSQSNEQKPTCYT